MRDEGMKGDLPKGWSTAQQTHAQGGERETLRRPPVRAGATGGTRGKWVIGGILLWRSLASAATTTTVPPSTTTPTRTSGPTTPTPSRPVPPREPGASVRHAAPKLPRALSVNGRPPLGAFGVDTLEHIQACGKLGMNLICSYDVAAAKQQLDVNTPMGKALAEQKMKVLYTLAGRFTKVRLAKDLTPKDTTVPAIGEEPASMEAFPQSGTLAIEGERITYSARTPESFTGCKRGVEGTKPGSHGAGILLCNSEELKKEVLAVKDSPNLWGYYLVDDARVNEGDSLREMSRVIRLHDRSKDGKPYNHVLVMGVGGISAMANFDKGVCDTIGIYLYPYRKGKLDQNIRKQMTYIVNRAKSLQPDIGLIGIFQAFRDDSPDWREMPSPDQVKEDLLSFFSQGASGAIGFIYHPKEAKGDPKGFESSPEICGVLTETYKEIREGKVQPTEPPVQKTEWFQTLVGRAAKPSKGIAAFDFEDEYKCEQLCNAHPPGRIVVEAQEAGGQLYSAQLAVSKYIKGDLKTQRFPGVIFDADFLTLTNWSKFRYLEQPIFNPQDHTIPLMAWLADREGGGWYRYTIPVPPKTPVLLRLPLEEAKMVANLAKVRHWELWFTEPTEDLTLYLGNPMLVPGKG